jgi:hypothetical protein
MTTPRRKPREDEHRHQVVLFQWAAMAAQTRPELGMLFAIPNGGHRHPAVAAKLKAEGVRAGVPDICLPVPRGPYHGLWIELKAPGGQGSRKGAVSPEQAAWIERLEAHGYWATACWGWESAREEIINYLEK